MLLTCQWYRRYILWWIIVSALFPILTAITPNIKLKFARVAVTNTEYFFNGICCSHLISSRIEIQSVILIMEWVLQFKYNIMKFFVLYHNTKYTIDRNTSYWLFSNVNGNNKNFSIWVYCPWETLRGF